jgi:hypothetical protein
MTPVLYEHHCSTCERTFVTNNIREGNCPLGHRRVRRQFSPPAIHRTIGTHFNHSVGEVVSNERDFKEKLKIGAEQASEDTGIEHRYQVSDMRDRDLYPLPEEG